MRGGGQGPRENETRARDSKDVEVFSSLPEPVGLCHSYSYGLRAIIQCLPAWCRFIQCLRRYRDTKRAFPHLVNAGKYSTTFFVVTFAALYATHRGKTHKHALTHGPDRIALTYDSCKRRVILSKVCTGNSDCVLLL